MITNSAIGKDYDRRITGTINSRVKSRQKSAQSPISFDYVVDLKIEKESDYPHKNEKREREWCDLTQWAIEFYKK